MADAEAAPIDTADEQASEANVVGEVLCAHIAPAMRCIPSIRDTHAGVC